MGLWVEAPLSSHLVLLEDYFGYCRSFAFPNNILPKKSISSKKELAF
jgi:hypothetical protein